MKPPERHAAYLAALDRQIEQAREVGPIDLAHSRPHHSGPFCAYCDKRWPCVPRRLADVARTALAGLRGRRSILVRHAPALCRLKPCDDPEHYVCDAHPARQWPCDDYRDAAAGLEAETS